MFNCVRADTIARIKNGYSKKLKHIQLRYSKETMNFLKVLKNEGYIEDFALLESDKKQAVAMTLRYDNKNRSALRTITIGSKPGQRRYVDRTNIPVVRNGLGCVILSTNRGLMTSHKAKALGIGGEVVAIVF